MTKENKTININFITYGNWQIEVALINKKEYVLVDKYDDFCENIVYHFKNSNSDIFALKKDDTFLKIEDTTTIDKIKDKYNLNPSYVVLYAGRCFEYICKWT